MGTSSQASHLLFRLSKKEKRPLPISPHRPASMSSSITICLSFLSALSITGCMFSLTFPGKYFYISYKPLRIHMRRQNTFHPPSGPLLRYTLFLQERRPPPRNSTALNGSSFRHFPSVYSIQKPFSPPMPS